MDDVFLLSNLQNFTVVIQNASF